MTYIGNEQQWKTLIEVDWLGQYIKAWIAFNAWYRNSFNLRSDWQIIEEIKNGGGDVCSKIENLLIGDSSDQISFQSDVADLHRSLSAKAIKSRSKRISFHEIEDYQFARPIDEKKNNVSYKIEIDVINKKRIVTITKSNGTQILYKTISREEEGINLDIETVASLSDAQKRTLKGLFNESTPVHSMLPIHSLRDHQGNHLEIGSFKFISNTTLIARAIIEILYQLRNTLFHGEITPDSETQRVYQPAYLILKLIIPGA